MSKIYAINNGESAAEQIPTLEYINELTKIFEDAYYSGTFNGFPTIKTNIEELPIGDMNQSSTISAENIVTDSQHKFVSDAMLSAMTNKPSKFEMQRSNDKIKEELKQYMDNIYMRIINIPSVINKLRDISTILNEDDITNGLINTLSNKLNIEDFQEHNLSTLHLNNNDRKALNIFIKCLAIGFTDWNADEGDYRAIKNKPESLPANGGNADTIHNHGINDLINKDDYDIVIGTSLEKYSKDCCDIYAENGILNKDVLNTITRTGIIHFKQGHYNIDYFNRNHSVYIIFTGANYRLTSIHSDNVVIMNNCSFRDISFEGCVVRIKSDCELKDVRFYECDIILERSENCKISECVIDSCKIKAEGPIMNNIITYNRYIKTKQFNYIGGNNIIKDNI